MAISNETTSNAPSIVGQFVSYARQIQNAERMDGFSNGGATVAYSGDGKYLTVNATIPLERVYNPDGSETFKPAQFLK